MTQTANQIRSAFLDFFKQRDHEVVASGPLIPPNDPTLMFANAGMVQFKGAFTGDDPRPYSRATSSQKCIRISGKHNDLEAVGPSPRHHTFFEMLGNFSFGDYFKEEAIVFAWDFFKEIGLPMDRLVVTYFKGEDGIPEDTEARELWKKVSGLEDARIIGCGKSENFWQAGDVGPCGPSSEIHIFSGGDGPVDWSTFGEEQASDGAGWMELWNLVFMQYDRPSKDAELQPLPKKCIDTGAGLERLAAILQGKLSNYDGDLLRSLVERVAEVAGKKYGASMEPDDVSMRVIADHARLTAFLVSEGVMPEKSKREYVLRRVMRRAIRHGHRLGLEELFLHEIAQGVVELMGEQYPELREKQEHIESVCQGEETRFRNTLARGLGLLEDEFSKLEKSEVKVLDGGAAFKLYDTFGFPLDLTEVICAEKGYTVDQSGYDAALRKAQEQSSFKPLDEAVEGVYRDALSKVESGQVEFRGYERCQDDSTIVALVVGGELVEEAGEGAAVEVITPRTPFYGEAGGQVGDRGSIRGDGFVIEIETAQKPVTGLVVHRGKVTQGSVKVGAAAELQVDEQARDATRRNHSATHLLHWALRKVVGDHAQQKGSHVGPDRLRFDYTHNSALTPEQISEIERLVNDAVLVNGAITTEILTMDEARERGAMMIFEEKYGDTVRLLSIGPSVELCGGTHARALGDIGLFKITGQANVAAGVRRVIAATGTNSLDYVHELEGKLERASQAARAGGGDVADKIEKILASERALQKQVDELQKKLLTGGGSGGMDAMLKDAREIAGVKVLGIKSEVTDRGALRELAEQLRDKLGDSVVLVASENEGKAQLVLTVAKPLTNRFKAGNLIKEVAAKVGGSGGGRPDMAQAGGTDVSKLGEAVDAVYSAVENVGA